MALFVMNSFTTLLRGVQPVRLFSLKVNALRYAAPSKAGGGEGGEKKGADKKPTGSKKGEKLGSGSLFGVGESRSLDISVNTNVAAGKVLSKEESHRERARDKKLRQKKAKANTKSSLAAAMKRKEAIAAVANKDKSKKKEKKPEYNLYQLLKLLPNGGLGLNVYRNHYARYEEPSYWTIVKITPASEKTKCRIFGVFTWRGKSALAVVRVTHVATKGWHCVEVPDNQLIAKLEPKNPEVATETKPTEPATNEVTAKL